MINRKQTKTISLAIVGMALLATFISISSPTQTLALGHWNLDEDFASSSGLSEDGMDSLVLLITLRKKMKIATTATTTDDDEEEGLEIEVVMTQLVKRKTRLTLPITIYRHVFLVSEENDHLRSRKCKTVWNQATGKWTPVIGTPNETTDDVDEDEEDEE